MMLCPDRILERKRAGESLSGPEIRAVIRGTSDGSWSDAQLGAFLMAVAIQGLDAEETRALTRAMLDSGTSWELCSEMPVLVDKHSTGGVGDKVSLVLAPLLAACGVSVVMLTGRALGHTGGTADKLESIPGLELELERSRCVSLLKDTGMAIGIATSSVAPADRRLYALRDATATVACLPLVTGSILSKKLAVGAAALVFDVKTGNGAFFPNPEAAVELAQSLVDTSRTLGRESLAMVTDMSQPLGQWAGHNAEIDEALHCLSGEGDERLMELTCSLCLEAARLISQPVDRRDLERAIASGRARQCFEKWAAAQGATQSWLRSPHLPLAPVEVVVEASRSGVLARVATRRLGWLLTQASGGRAGANRPIDRGVALRYRVRLGQPIERGDEICRIYLRRHDSELIHRFQGAFEIDDDGESPPLIYKRVG